MYTCIYIHIHIHIHIHVHILQLHLHPHIHIPVLVRIRIRIHSDVYTYMYIERETCCILYRKLHYSPFMANNNSIPHWTSFTTRWITLSKAETPKPGEQNLRIPLEGKTCRKPWQWSTIVTTCHYIDWRMRRMRRMRRMWMMTITYGGFDHWGFTMVLPCFYQWKDHSQERWTWTSDIDSPKAKAALNRKPDMLETTCRIPTCAQKCTCHAIVGDGAWSMTSEEMFFPLTLEQPPPPQKKKHGTLDR